MTPSRPQLVIITGYSGSGKSSSLRILEGFGYYCVDNLPADLLPQFVKLTLREKSYRKLAVVIDARSENFMTRLESDLEVLKSKINVQIIFFEAMLQTIVSRYQAMRYSHPVALDGTVADGYKREVSVLKTLRQRADFVIRTDKTNVHTLKDILAKHLRVIQTGRFEVVLQSFGYKYGLPLEADVVLDVRHVINPFFVKNLRALTGRSDKVRRFIMADPMARQFLKRTESYLWQLIKNFQKVDKPSLHIALGCTGGKHRSVTFVETLAKTWKKKGVKLQVRHRDLTNE